MRSCFVAIYLCAVTVVSSQSCSNPDADVLILGAGLSGIAAAHTLNASGVTNFLILEALPRIGGRIQKAEFPSGVKVEIGANWIQGFDPQQPEISMHPLYAILQRCGVDTQGKVSDYDNITVYDSQGNSINDDALRYNDYETAIEAAEESVPNHQINNLPDISVREGLTMNGWVPATPEDNWVEWFEFDFCFTEPPDITSLYRAASLPTYIDFGDPEETGDFFITDERGFVQVVDCLADEFLEGEQDLHLHLNANVSEVQWSDECICVEAIQNGEPRTYCAPYAIITFSIGVLQSEELNMRFVPSLPQWKLDVINMFSMTHYLIFIAEFNSSFWDDVEFVGHIADQRGYFPLFQPLDKFIGANVILATLTEEIANRLVRQPAENSTAELVKVLRGIYGPSVPEPVNVIIPDWDVNPLFLGSYSNVPVGVTSETFAQLAAPVGGLFFSGEATSASYNGFVHGAYFAGIDSANALIEARRSGAFQAARITTIWVACLLISALIGY